jgi:hypothetical protein
MDIVSDDAARAIPSVATAKHSRPKDGVASLADEPAMHGSAAKKDVDARYKAVHDG